MREEVPAPIDDPAYSWRTGDDGAVLMLRATALGLSYANKTDSSTSGSTSIAIEAASPTEVVYSAGNMADGRVAIVSGHPEDFSAGSCETIVPPASGKYFTKSSRPAMPAALFSVEAPQAAWSGQADLTDCTPEETGLAGAQGPEVLPVPSVQAGRQDTLRRAAQVLLDAWDTMPGCHQALTEAMNRPIAGLRAALASRTAIAASAFSPPQPRDSKQAQVIAMLARDEGVSGPQIAEAMGWAAHTVRGFLATLAKKGIRVGVRERIRQVGLNKAGTKGSYSVYRLVERDA